MQVISLVSFVDDLFENKRKVASVFKILAYNYTHSFHDTCQFNRQNFGLTFITIRDSIKLLPIKI